MVYGYDQGSHLCRTRSVRPTRSTAARPKITRRNNSRRRPFRNSAPFAQLRSTVGMLVQRNEIDREEHAERGKTRNSVADSSNADAQETSGIRARCEYLRNHLRSGGGQFADAATGRWRTKGKPIRRRSRCLCGRARAYPDVARGVRRTSSFHPGRATSLAPQHPRRRSRDHRRAARPDRLASGTIQWNEGHRPRSFLARTRGRLSIRLIFRCLFSFGNIRFAEVSPERTDLRGSASHCSGCFSDRTREPHSATIGFLEGG